VQNFSQVTHNLITLSALSLQSSEICNLKSEISSMGWNLFKADLEASEVDSEEKFYAE
jgi:hypothetical protein